MNTAFVFPGQGSQSVGMLADFLPKYSIITELFNEASEVLGYDLWHLIQNGPQERLNQTEYTQVAMLVADIAVYQLLMQSNIPQPQIMAGHSLGEYAALVCADALSLKDAVRLVAKRGEVMQQAVPLGVGAMAAIVGLSDEQVKEICTTASHSNEQVNPANFNAVGQVVIAGYTPAVNRAVALAQESGALLAKLIPVSVPCHCTLLKDAADVFSSTLESTSFKSPVIDVISNVDLSVYYSAQHIRNQLKEQLYSPVRWVETIQLFSKRGIKNIVECGPGKVLNGLVKRIDRGINVVSVNTLESLEQLIEQIIVSA